MILLDNDETVAISDYCAKHHDPRKSPRNTQFLLASNDGDDPDWDWLLGAISANWDRQKAGYREGVILVPVPAAIWIDTGPGEDGEAYNLFTCPVAELQEGDVFRGSYERRRPTETPRRRVGVVRSGMPYARFVDVVLYRGDVLDEDTENPRSTKADWEVVTILGKLTDEDQPMPTGTLMANHFLADGGTDTRMSDAEFIAELRRSFEFWSNKAIIDLGMTPASLQQEERF